MAIEAQYDPTSTDPPVPQPQVTLEDIISAEDSRQTFELVAENPVEVGRLLQSAEDQVARAGAALEIGFRTKHKEQQYRTSFGQYASFVSLVTEGKLNTLLANGSQEGAAKTETVDFLRDSKIRILTQDLHYRLHDSSLERSKERVARGRISRMAGKLAVTGASVGLAYLGMKGVETGMEDMGVDTTENFLSTIGVLAASRVIKNGFELLGDKTRHQIDEYTPLKKDGDKAAPSKIKGSFSSAIDFAELDKHVADLEEKLFLVAGRNLLAAGVTPTELVRKLLETFSDSFDTFYGLKKDKEKEEVETSTVVLGSVMSAYVEKDDLSEDIEAVVHEVREVMPKHDKHKGATRAKHAHRR